MKPQWKDAPDWAKWLAKDSDEVWNWYEHQPTKPTCRCMRFHCESGRSQEIESEEVYWRYSLEPRPEVGG